MTVDVRTLPIGVDLMAEGRFREALAPLRLAVSLGQASPSTVLNLAIAEDRAGDRDRARRLIRQVAVQLPAWDEPILRLAESFRAAGEIAFAENAYRQVLELNPTRPEALIALAGLLLMRREAETARDLLLRCCGTGVDNPEAWNTLGLALRETGAFGLALSAFVKAQGLKPESVDYILNGVEVTLLANEAEAELARLTVACEQSPLNAALQIGRGVLLDRLNLKAQAIDALEAATGLAPDALLPLRLLGGVLARFGRNAHADHVLRRAIALDPDNAALRNEHAVVLMRMHRFPEARAILRDVRDSLQSNNTVLCNLANSTVCVGDQEEAVAIAQQAILAEPESLLARRALCNTLPYLDGITGHALLAAMRACSAMITRTPQPALVNAPDPDRRLTVGLLSGSLRSHPVGWLTVAGVEALDPSAFRLVCLAQNAAPHDPISRRYRTCAEEWLEIDYLEDTAVANLAREKGIDILIDLGGYGDSSRMLACANRLAPVQIKWVGMQTHTSGLDEMDWFLTDRWETPQGFDQFYSEKLLRLPDGYVCYSPPAHAPDVVEPPALVNGFVTFGCFNNLAKITPRVIQTWATILHRVPHSQMIIKTHQLSDALTADGFRERFTALGISAERIDLRGSSGHRAFMREHGHVDIMLDPFPYSGGLTTCEALWMGVPVITMPGETFSSRHSVSHVSNAGLADWVAESVEGYVDLAVARANDVPALAALRARLREQVRRSPLCDARRFGQGLGAALRHAWRAWCEQQA